jgi:ArsR family transcriptional regulator, arsenate/arsenite/antimonite-responsive transcriptional repressor
MDTNAALAALSALAHPVRLRIFRLLIATGGDGMPAGQIAEAVAGVQNTISTNLAILARAGLVRSRRQGRTVRYGADLDAARALIGFLLEDCCEGRPEVCAPLLDQLQCMQVDA